KLRNDSDFTVRKFRLEVEIPKKYASSPTFSEAEVLHHNKGDVKLYRRTEEKLRSFVLYPGDETPDSVLSLDFLLRHSEYRDVDEQIKIRLYFDDGLLNETSYAIRDFRNKDRMNLLSLTN